MGVFVICWVLEMIDLLFVLKRGSLFSDLWIKELGNGSGEELDNFGVFIWFMFIFVLLKIILWVI